MTPLISVVIPVRNESDRVTNTIRSIADMRSTDCDLEIIVVDDASVDGDCSKLIYKGPGVSISTHQLKERVGVPGARNYGANTASGDILFITDAHVRFCEGWDRYVLENLEPNRVIAATVRDIASASAFKGYGCSLSVPFMGTRWNKKPPEGTTPVQIAASIGTVLERTLFEKVGGYDSGMILYGAAEPEFSVRCWLSGAEIVSVPELEIYHKFKLKDELDRHVEELRLSIVHNCLRFGLLYLDEVNSLQMIRYFALSFPDHAQEAFRLLESSDVWQRRNLLKSTLTYDFDWFSNRFDVENVVKG